MDNQQIDDTYSLPSMQIPQGAIIRPDTETIKFRLDPNDVISKIEHALKGEHWVTEQLKDSDGKPVVDRKSALPILIEGYKKAGFAMTNEYGALAISNTLSTMLGKNTLLSNLTEEEVNLICRNIGHATLNLIESEHRSFDISASYMETIIFPVTTEPLFQALKRAQGAGERDSISKSWQVHEMHSDGGGGQRRSLNPFNWIKSNG